MNQSKFPHHNCTLSWYFHTRKSISVSFEDECKNTNMCPYTPWGHIRGEDVTPFIVNLGTRWRWVVKFVSRSLYSQGGTESPTVHIFTYIRLPAEFSPVLFLKKKLNCAHNIYRLLILLWCPDFVTANWKRTQRHALRKAYIVSNMKPRSKKKILSYVSLK